MSYCVNCGVELAESEKQCPLCGVAVQNPAAPWHEPRKRPYPHRLDEITRRADKRYFLSVAAVLLSIPMLVTMVSDLLAGGGITWSGYVLGSIGLVFVFVFMPLSSDRPHIALCIFVDTLATALFLFLVETLMQGKWFLGLGLPITLIAGGMAIFCEILFHKARMGLFARLAVVFILLGLFTVCLEMLIDAFLLGHIALTWSPYSLVPCVVLALALLILNKRNRFREELKRRFFI